MIETFMMISQQQQSDHKNVKSVNIYHYIYGNYDGYQQHSALESKLIKNKMEHNLSLIKTHHDFTKIKT